MPSGRWCSSRLLCPVSLESALGLLPTDPAPVGTEILYAAQPEVHTGIAPVDEAVRQALPAAEPTHSANPLQIASAVGAAVWAAGGAGMLLAGGISLLRLRRRLRGARGVEAGVWVAAGLPTAFVLGVVRPRIYLPEGLNDRERGLILAHERAHIRRRDPALRLLAWTALCLHWFNPLVWLAFALSGGTWRPRATRPCSAGSAPRSSATTPRRCCAWPRAGASP